MKNRFTILFALLCVSVMSFAADTEVFVPANASLLKTTGQLENQATYNSSAGTITGTVQAQAGWQWGAQIHLTHGVSFTSGKKYVFSCDITTSNATNNITIKVCDTQERLYKTDFATEANVANTYSGEFTSQGNETSAIVFDFGFALANTAITISNISIKEKEVAPAGPVSYCEYEAEHLASHSADSRVLISLEPTANTNEYKMTVKTNSTKKLDYLYVTATGNSPYPATSGTDDNGDEFDEMSVTFTNSSTTASFYIAWSNPNWGGRWDYNLNDVTMADLVACGSSSSDEEKPSMADATVSVDSKTHNSVVLAISGATDNVGVTKYVVKNHSDDSSVGEYAPAENKITISGLSPETAYNWDVYAKDAAGNVSDNCKNITFTTDALASNYCGETLVDGTATVDMSCEFKNNKYIITFTNPTLNSEASTLAGFNGSFCTIGGAGAHDVRDYYSVNNSERIVLEFDGVPNFYTPMYINIPANNQRTFSWPNDVVWGSCPAVAVTGVSLNLDELEMQVGGATQTLVATIAPSNATNQNVTWASDHPEVASVINGVVTAEGEGFARITVTTEDGGFTDYCDVTVTVPAVAQKVYNDYATTDVNNIFILYSVTRNVDQTLTFKLDEFEHLPDLFGFVDPEVWVNNIQLGKMSLVAGKYTFTTAGTYIPDDELSCKFHFVYGGGGDKYITFSYTVGSEQAAPASVPVGSVVLNKESNTLSVGETDNLTATVYPSFASAAGTITWVSDAPAYATVDNGTVTAVAAGTANITATCGGVTSDPYVVTVTASLTEAKFYGCEAFANKSGKVVSYDYAFTRATNHEVTLELVFSRSMNGIVGSGNFEIYINSALQHMTYDDATRTATYEFGALTEGASFNYYFRFPLDGGGLHQIPQTAYVVGSSNDAVHAFAIGENEDNVAALTAADGQTFNKVFVNRSFTADNLYTLVLPFDADASVLPGQLTKLNNTIVKENGDLKVNFVDVDAIEAGVPYLYVPSANVANPVFENVTINKNLNPTEPADGKAKYYGIYAPTTGAELKLITNAYVLGNDKYLYAVTGLEDNQQMKALRGYFVLDFQSSVPGAPMRKAQVVFNEVQSPTGIESVQTSSVSVQKMMQDGQIYIIRDGKMYNAQGQLVK